MSAISKILSIVAGHVEPESISLINVNVDESISQLSEKFPPAVIKSLAVNTGGNSEISQINVSSIGQVINGAIVSFTIIFWTQVPTFPHESAIEYVLVNNSGHVLPSETSSTNMKVVSSTPQLSIIEPPAEINSL